MPSTFPLGLALSCAFLAASASAQVTLSSPPAPGSTTPALTTVPATWPGRPASLVPIAAESLEVLGVAPDALGSAPGGAAGGLLAVRTAGSNVVQLFDASSGKLRREVRLPPEVLLNVPPALSPDGKWLAVAIQADAATNEGRLGLFSTTDPVYRFFLKSGGLRGISSFAFSPDGTRLAVGNRNSYVQLWNMDTRERLATIKGTSLPVALSFSPDGKLFLARFRGQKSGVLVNGGSGQPIATLVEAGGDLLWPDLLLTPGGRALSLPSGTPTPLPAYLAGGVTFAGFDRQRQKVLVSLSTADLLVLELRDVLTGTPLGRWTLPAPYATQPRLMPDGQHALVGDGAGGLRLLTLR